MFLPLADGSAKRRIEPLAFEFDVRGRKTEAIMATPSRMLPLGSPLPSIRLINAVDGQWVDVSALAAGKAHKRGTLVLFICNHCPYVVHIRPELVRATHEALDRGLAAVAINSN